MATESKSKGKASETKKESTTMAKPKPTTKAATAATKRSERLDVRVSAEIKHWIEQAALLSGQSITAFVLDATVSHATRVIQESQEITLSNRDRDRFLAALDRDDAGPNEAMLKAVARYKAANQG